jgi:gluconokinase
VNSVELRRAEPPLVLALDVGTSSCRGSLWDARGRRIEGIECQHTYTPRTTVDGGAEFDADRLVDLVREVLDGVLALARPAHRAIAAVGSCSFWHSLLGLDATGRPATPLLLWLDARASKQAAALREELDERAVHARTGCVLHWSYWPAKLRWLQATQPAMYRWVDRWVSFSEYLEQKLFGDSKLGVSMASGTGLLNQHTQDWDADLLAALPLDRRQLSPIAGSEAYRPSANLRRWKLDGGPRTVDLAWLPTAGDGACNNLGAGCASRERLTLMVGTSAAVRALWRAEAVEIPWGAWCYRAGPRRFVIGGAMNDGGSLLAWLRSSLRLPDLAALEPAVAALEPDAHGLTLLPLWGGERSPGWANDARGSILGLRLHTSPADIYRAALEGIALYLARLTAIVQQAVPEAREIVATGGALLHSPAWLQIMADVLERPVLVSAEAEASSRGAALLALEGLGAVPNGAESFDAPIAGTFEPIPARGARYRAAAVRQSRLYDQLVQNGARVPSA